jgi:hypothetical protein
METKLVHKTLSFTLDGFKWTLYLVDQVTDFHGETQKEQYRVIVNTRGMVDQSIRETIMHELLHCCFGDQAKLVFGQETDKVDEKEEELVRLLSPRLLNLFSNNPQLAEVVFGFTSIKIKKIKN